MFGRTAPVVLEIGFGMGEATAAMAAAQPGLDVLAVDVHTPGHGNLLKLVEAAELTNVRVVSGDARVLLGSMLGPASLHEVRVFFPDPWPKAKHVKRRLVTTSFADLVADRLVDGGRLHVATDMAAYAEQVAEVLGGAPRLRGQRRGAVAGSDQVRAPRPRRRPPAVRPRGRPSSAQLVLDALLQVDRDGLTGLLADRLADVGLHRELVAAVAHRHERAAERLLVDGAPRP